MKKRHAIHVLRSENFSDWYHAVIAGADLAERSDVRGCMIIKPYGYAIWEKIQSIINSKLKTHGVQNCYFPLFVPIDVFAKEAEHVSGFAKEVAVVTHSRIEQDADGNFIPTSPLEHALAIRPTSEMIIGASFAKWINSYRDLPLKVNQWCNVVRWEMRPRMFLRTMEFLWQEGHTAHATAKEAIEMANGMHNAYIDIVKNSLFLTCFAGKKPEHEKFPGAVDTYTVECMMQDGRALQMCTSHYLGQNFAKAMNIKFQSAEEKLEYVYTTSFGATTRLIGSIIMAHGDDDGLNLPTCVAPYHVVILPIIRGDEKSSVLEYCEKLQKMLDGIDVLIDSADYSVADKKWNYIRKGVPIICEIGLMEVKQNTVCYTLRQPEIVKQFCSMHEFVSSISDLLNKHDATLREKHKQVTEQNTMHMTSLADVQEYFAHNTGFVVVRWCGCTGLLSELEKISVTVRCQTCDNCDMHECACIACGKKAENLYILAKAY